MRPKPRREVFTGARKTIVYWEAAIPAKTIAISHPRADSAVDRLLITWYEIRSGYNILKLNSLKLKQIVKQRLEIVEISF